MKKHLLSVLCLLPLCAGCPTLGKATHPQAPIDAAAVAPLWNSVLVRYNTLVEQHVDSPTKETWLLDSELLQSILDKAVNQLE